jgi:hypothetical protein
VIISTDRYPPYPGIGAGPHSVGVPQGALALAIHQQHRKEVSHVYQHPYMASQLASERRREMLAQAEQHNRARKVAALARASRRAEQAERRMRRAVRRALRLRAGLGQ